MAEEDEFGNEEDDETPEDALPEETPEYEGVAQEEPERPVDLEKYAVGDEDVGEDIEDAIVRSDFQAGLQAITPVFVDKRQNELLQPIMKSRVFPDNYLDLNYLLTTMMIEELENDSREVDFLRIVTGNQVATTIAYDGKHIIDVSELYGAAREADMEKLSKQILGE